MLYRRLEEVALNSWPALQQIIYDGWVLRFAGGYTKRANSVNPLYESSLSLADKVAYCEQRYQERGLPPIFRLNPLTAPPALDRLLEQRGYQLHDLSQVLHLDLRQADLNSLPRPALREEPLERWLALFSQLSGTPLEQHETHAIMLQAIPSRRMLVALEDQGAVIACAAGVLEGSYFGLFDLLTAPHARNRGYGTGLVAALLHTARTHGAEHAYLQVHQGNEPARRLYARLGYREVYPYWYRISRF